MGIREINNYDKWKTGEAKAYYIDLLPIELQEEGKDLLHVHMWTLKPNLHYCIPEKREEILSYLKTDILSKVM